MPSSYATPADLANWLPAGVVVDDPARLLARASRVVDRAVRAPYATDNDGLPTDDEVAAALRDAACAQVESWTETGEENDLDGGAGAHIAVTGYSGPRGHELAPRALRELVLAGLTQPVDTRR